MVRGTAVVFARPVFNFGGTRVLVSELGGGSINNEGKLHLESQWSILGNVAQGDYTGKLTEAGGTLAGVQTWTRPDGSGAVKRTCYIAVVPASDQFPKNPARFD